MEANYNTGMSKRLAVVLLTFGVSACGGEAGGQSEIAPAESAPQNSPVPTAAVTPQPPPTILPPGPCDHLLWPLVDGASWRYQLSRPDGSAQEVLLSAVVSGDAATLALDMGAGSLENAITCAPDGFYGALSGLVGHPDLGAGLVLANPDRPFLPSADHLLPLGTVTSWDAQYDATGTISLPLADGASQATVTGGDVVLYTTTEPLETVTVPAGTFHALPVAQSILFNLQVTTAEGVTGGVFGDAQTRLYWAEGVGMVRQEFEGGMLSSTLAGEAITLEAGVTLDLLEVQVPGG